MRSPRPSPPFLLLLPLLLLGLLLACRCCRASSGSPTPHPLQSCKTHEVQAGDGCNYIAKDNGITVKEFEGWNPGMECSNLQIGQILCVSDPGGGSPPPPESCKTYTVKDGDRCYYIAQDNGITVDELRGWNPGMECSNLQIGQILCVSEPGGGSPPPESCKIYTVKPGDECWSIALHNSITEEELDEWNVGMVCSDLQIGQKLCISDPGGGPPSEPCRTYTVKAGDGCYDIAWSNGITVGELEWWNPAMECSNLWIGELLCVSEPEGGPPPQFCKAYTVKAGDRCWSIAEHNGISVADLYWWNPDLDCAKLEIGEILCISNPSGGSPPAEPCRMYDVKAGDRCQSIARDNGITVKDLKWWNPGLDCSNLAIGDILCVSEPYYHNGNIKAQRLVARKGKEEA